MRLLNWLPPGEGANTGEHQIPTSCWPNDTLLILAVVTVLTITAITLFLYFQFIKNEKEE